MKFVAATIFIVAMIANSNAMAGQHTGKIVNFHLNSSVPGRGVCFKMSPALDGTGWACLYSDNVLYKELTTLILAGYMAGKTCLVNWDLEDSQMHKIVRVAECQ